MQGGPQVSSPGFAGSEECHSTPLLRDSSPSAISSYIPHRSRTAPPSIIGDVLSYLASIRLPQLARYELAAERGEISDGDWLYEALLDARADPRWREKLELLGVPPVAFFGGYQFRRGQELSAPAFARGTASQEQRVRHALARAREGALLFFSLHFRASDAEEEEDDDDDEFPHALLRGRLGSPSNTTFVVRLGRAGGTVRAGTGAKPCDNCSEARMPACAVLYDEAVIAGLLGDYFTSDEINVNLDRWQAAIETEPPRKGKVLDRSGLCEQLDRAREGLADEVL